MEALNRLAEDGFLKLILNPRPNKWALEKHLSSNFDWDYIRQNIDARKLLTPIFYRNLNNLNFIGELPKPWQSELKKTYLINLARNAILLDEFFKIQAALKAQDIAIMPLKGMALLFCAYKDIGSRPMTDIDILIQKKDAERTRGLLLKIGYQLSQTPFNYSKMRREKILLDVHHDLWYLKSLSKLKSNLYGIHQIWGNAQMIHWEGGNSTRIMAPEDLLINVTAHAGIDSNQLTEMQVFDIANICEVYQDKLDWNIFMGKVISYNLEIPTHHLLKLVKAQTNARIPQFILDKLKPLKNRLLEVKLYERILAGPPIPRVGHFLRIVTSNCFSGKLRLILFYLFPDREFMVLRYKLNNKNLAYFYYPLRIASFFPKIFKIVLRLLKT